jgi:hypothetical protein
MGEEVIRFMHNGRVHDAVNVTPENKDIHLGKITLTDGKMFELRLDLVSVMKLIDELDANGKPAYVFCFNERCRETNA